MYEHNPSLNRYFVEPCVAVFGSWQVREALLDLFEQGSNFEKAGAVNALYWAGFPSFSKSAPKFKNNCRSVEYKTSGWKLSPDRRSINFLDKKGIGKLKLKGTWDLYFYPLEQIKRARLVRRADGYYVQFLIRVESEKVDIMPTGRILGLDVGIKQFYTDSNGITVPNPKFYRTSEKRLKFRQRRVSRKKKGSVNRHIAINKLGRVHLKISGALTRTLRDWQREEHAKRVARCIIQSNDLVAYEDLRIKNLIKNHCLAKSINDASW